MENGRDGVYGALVRLLATKRGSLTRAVKTEPGPVMATIVWATIEKQRTASRPDVVSVSLLKPHFIHNSSPGCPLGTGHRSTENCLRCL